MESTNRFDEAFDRIKKATGMRTQVEIAKLLDIRQSSISDAKRRQSIPDSWLNQALSDLQSQSQLAPGWRNASISRRGPGRGRAGPANPETATTASPNTIPCRLPPWPCRKEWKALGRKVATDCLTVPEQFYLSSLLVVRMDESDMVPTIQRGAYVGIDRERKTIRSGAPLCHRYARGGTGHQNASSTTPKTPG